MGTHNGLDRFRKADFVPVVLPVPLRAPQMVAGEGGDLWLQGMNLDARVHGGRAITKGHEIVAPPEPTRGSYHDSSGTIWWLGDQNIVLTTYAGDIQAVRALKAGARAYLLRTLLRKELEHQPTRLRAQVRPGRQRAMKRSTFHLERASSRTHFECIPRSSK